MFATLGSGFMASAYGSGMKQLITEGKINFGTTIRDFFGGMAFNLGFSQCGNMMGKILASAGKNAAAKAEGSALSKCLREGLKTGLKVGAGNSAADITRQAIDNKGLTNTNWKEVAQNAAAGFGFDFGAGVVSSAISIAKGARGAGKGSSENVKVSKGNSGSSWYNKDGTINYPPNNGAVPGTEKKILLRPGDTIGRYGEIGKKSIYVTQTGVNPDKLSLPPNTSPKIYQEFKVLKKIPDTIQSKVIEWGGSAGGGLQYELPMPIRKLIREGYIIPK